MGFARVPPWRELPWDWGRGDGEQRGGQPPVLTSGQGTAVSPEDPDPSPSAGVGAVPRPQPGDRRPHAPCLCANTSRAAGG